jgi:hypothetical protein
MRARTSEGENPSHRAIVGAVTAQTKAFGIGDPEAKLELSKTIPA